ncbi:MAG: HAMP domain-containing protein [Ignavibacteria bacterium]|nr:HAMP domain-containing protein [Ignavibacteria bacterium]
MSLSFFSRVKLRTKLQVAFYVLVVLSTGTAGWQAFNIARESIERITFDRLTSIRETKKREIETYMRQLHNEALAVAEDGRTAEAARACLPDGGPETVRALYREMFRRLGARFAYDDLLLADSATGSIVFSIRGSARQALHPEDRAQGGGAMARVFREARDADAPDFARISDFEQGADGDAAPAFFIAAPVFDHGRKIAVLLLRISTAHIDRVMTGIMNWERDGLGRTGESYLVGEDATMRSNSRFFIEAPGEYIAAMRKRGVSAQILERMRRQHSTILLQEAHTSAVLDALAGRADTRIVTDYRGVAVLSAYAPLSLPGVRWAILAEIDVNEAFASVFALRERIVMLSLFIFLFAAILAFAISQTVTRPIQALATVTERFGRGDLAGRAAIGAQDEIGDLAATFNRMAENTMQNTAQLQSEIASRMRIEQELRDSREELRNLSRYLQTAREEERKGVAREIHDELGQALTTLKLNLALLKRDAAALPDGAAEQLSQLMDLTDSTIQSVKRIITELRPGLLDDLGLFAAIEWQAEEFQARTGIRCQLALPEEEVAVDQERATALFRIFQETLTNVTRHAGASLVRASFERRGTDLLLVITDNGRGIRAEQLRDPAAFGLMGMRERALYWGGRIDITGTEQRGTTVRVCIPLPTEETRL